MLGFSRRQATNPKLIDLNDLVFDMDIMLCRLIGDDIKLVTSDAENLAIVKVDPGQIEQVLMNLVVNARDAMAAGGSITIGTASFLKTDAMNAASPDIPAGPYVLLSVSDTGSGMTEDVKAHIFEAFFTTKGEDQGTGLGLATCQSIIQQNNGYIQVDSELGVGTTFRVYLPSMDAASQAGILAEDAAELPVGAETILLAEDELLVGTIITTMLHQLGYNVLEAINGEEALGLLEALHGQSIDLLLTDVIMPNMGGLELATRFKARLPGAGIIFTSGYMEEGLICQGFPNTEHRFIQKPFLQRTLACTVREALDG